MVEPQALHKRALEYKHGKNKNAEDKREVKVSVSWCPVEGDTLQLTAFPLNLSKFSYLGLKAQCGCDPLQLAYSIAPSVLGKQKRNNI